MPVYTGGTSEVLLRWYDEGLNAFGRVCAVGDALYRRFAPRLLHCLQQPEDTEALQALLDDTRHERESMELDLSNGRDRLLELSSCRRSSTAAAG